ncbi:FMN reductase (NADPH) [compost metagenome]
MEQAASEQTEQTLNSTEMFMVGVIDAALAAQNAAIAAESMGLGVCYIGGIRNKLEEVSELLETPERVIPLFGMSVGIPKNHSDKKPRLPLEHIYHEEQYQQDNQLYVEQLEQYNAVISGYYSNRTNGERQDRWTEAMSALLNNPNRLYMKRFLQNKQLPLL